MKNWRKAWGLLVLAGTLACSISLSTTLAAHRESAVTGDGLQLGIKRLANPGAVPILMIHGVASNDRIWDSPVSEFSFGKLMHAYGYDVWIGNLRGAGTPGYESEAPEAGAWTVEDHATQDLPALIGEVRRKTGKAPWVFCHSLCAWAMEGYLTGLELDSDYRPHARPSRASFNQKSIRGVVSFAGVYGLSWPKSLENWETDPVRTRDDYYQSNYEVETLARFRPLYMILPYVYRLPMGWISTAITLPLEKLPWVGSQLNELYENFQHSIIRTPILSLFYYSPNSDSEMVRQHSRDGIEDISPLVLEQLGNTILDGETSSYYHRYRDLDDGSNGEIYRYKEHRLQTRFSVPMLFVAGGRDRLANIEMIYRDGYEMVDARCKDFIAVEDAGHLDILTGKTMATQTVPQIVQWMRGNAGETAEK